MKNRSRLDILYDIITASRPMAKKTHLMYKSNLSFKQLDIYLGILLENGLLQERNDIEQGRVFCATNRGITFTRLFEQIQTFLGSPPEIQSTESEDSLASVKVIEKVSKSSPVFNY